MSMSTSVVGFRPPDEKWKTMKEVWDSCKKAGIEIPKEVDKFFNYTSPDESGVEVNLDKCTKDYRNDYSEGLEINLEKIPKDIKIIRFVNSW